MDQCSEDTLIYCWSGFDLRNCINLDERCNRLRDLFVLFYMEKVHTVQKFEDKKEKKLVDALRRGYQVILSFPPKICNCTPTYMEAEFRKAWPCINSLQLVEVNSARREKQKPSQLNVLQKFLNNHATEFPNVIQFVFILFASPGNTSCLERGYTFLEMICAKRLSKMKSDLF